MDDHAVQTAVKRLKRGDITGLAVLVERYQVQAVRTAYLITVDRALAEDVVQSAFLRAYERIDQFDAARPFAPWFSRIVVNAALQALKRQQRQVSLDAETPDGDASFAEILPDHQPDPDTLIETAELQSAIKTALGELSSEQRAVIVLRYYLDYSEQELAEALGSPPGTIKWRLHAARKRLGVLLRQFAKGQEV